MSFEKLELSIELLKAIKDQGYTDPTPVQNQAIPVIMQGKDVLVSAQTGTGKTASFTLPLLHHISQRIKEQPAATQAQGRHPAKPPIRALILTPTRELAAQVFENVRTYSKYLPIKSLAVYGGVSIGPQIDRLRRGVDVLVATPGRLLDLLDQNALQLSMVETFVLDEADRMLDMGFIHDIRSILDLLPQRRQTLLFSATFSPAIKDLANRLLYSPTIIEVARSTSTAARISHIVYPTDRERKRELLSFMIGSKNWRQVLVFTRTKHGANRLALQLESDGLPSTAIHGNKTQAARSRALADFKQGKVRVLVATDVAARGIDIDRLPYVVNFDLPNSPEDYVHRVGRTGRASNDGVAVSLVCIDEHFLLKSIEKLLQFKLPQEVITGFAPNPAIKAEPIQMGRKSGGGGRSQAAPNNRRSSKQRSYRGASSRNSERSGNGRAANGERSGGGRPDGERSSQSRSGRPGGERSGRPAGGAGGRRGRSTGAERGRSSGGARKSSAHHGRKP